MTTPNTSISVNRRGLGVSPFSGGDIIAIIGPAAAGEFAGPDDGTGVFSIGSSASIREKYQRGPMPQLATYVREALFKGKPLGRPVVCVRCATSIPGSVGDLDTDGWEGTAVPLAAVTTADDDYQIGIVFDVGCTLGVKGAVYRVTKDGGRNYSPPLQLGTQSRIVVDNSGGVAFDLDPADADVTALIALAVEAREETLDHLANNTAHDAADTSSAQAALLASSVPTTKAQAVSVLNLCLAALAVHELDITAHNGPDVVNTVSHAAATNASSGVDLAIEYKTKFNLHLAATFAAAPAGLHTATATVASTNSLVESDLLAPGLALMATNPRRVSFTTAGATASDAPATAFITGTAWDDSEQTETVNLSQSAGTVLSTKAYKTVSQIDFAAGDGTGATIAVGYGQGIHNSADATNTISAAAPEPGTVVAGATLWADAAAPSSSAQDLADALSALSRAKLRVDLVAITTPITTTALRDVIVNQVIAWEEQKKQFKPILFSFRLRGASESEANYRVAWKALFDGVQRDGCVCGYDGGIADSRIDSLARYRRTSVWPLALMATAAEPGEDLAFVDDGLGAVPGWTILDDNGTPLFHDEDNDPGPDDDRAVTMRTVPGYVGTFITNPRTLAQPGTDLYLLQYYRAVAKTVASADLFFTGKLSKRLTPDIDTGLLAEHEVEILQRNADAVIAQDVVTPGWAAGAQAVLDNTANLFATPTIHVDISVVPFLYAKAWNLKIGLKNPFKKA